MRRLSSQLVVLSWATHPAHHPRSTPTSWRRLVSTGADGQDRPLQCSPKELVSLDPALSSPETVDQEPNAGTPSSSPLKSLPVTLNLETPPSLPSTQLSIVTDSPCNSPLKPLPNSLDRSGTSAVDVSSSPLDQWSKDRSDQPSPTEAIFTSLDASTEQELSGEAEPLGQRTVFTSSLISSSRGWTPLPTPLSAKETSTPSPNYKDVWQSVLQEASLNPSKLQVVSSLFARPRSSSSAQESPPHLYASTSFAHQLAKRNWSSVPLTQKPVVGIWLAGDVFDYHHVKPTASWLATNLRRLGSRLGSVSHITCYQDCISARSPADRSFRTDLSNSGVEILHERSDVDLSQKGLRFDIDNFLANNSGRPTALIIAATSSNPIIDYLNDQAVEGREIIVLGLPRNEESVTSKGRLHFIPWTNLVHKSTASGLSHPPPLEIVSLFEARHNITRVAQPAFDINEFLPSKTRTPPPRPPPKAPQQRRAVVPPPKLDVAANFSVPSLTPQKKPVPPPPSSTATSAVSDAKEQVQQPCGSSSPEQKVTEPTPSPSPP